MSTILDQIVAKNRPALAARIDAVPFTTMRRMAEQSPPPRPYRAALLEPGIDVIAEIKRASPSKGELRRDFDVASIARSYNSNGAACLSVLTEGFYFRGEIEHLQLARASSPLPVLRKDFLFDAYQVYESRAFGADAVLLIVAILEPSELRDLHAAATSLGMAVQVEVHNEGELDRALAVQSDIIVVNNRDLRDFTVDLGTTERLVKRMSSGVVRVSESGIKVEADVRRLAASGVDAIHVGEAFMTAADPGLSLAQMVAWACAGVTV